MPDSTAIRRLPMRPTAPERLPDGAFRVRRPIRFSHTDPAGIVYFPVYFDMFNALVEDWFTHELGFNYAELIRDRRLGVPTVHVECDFLHPSRLGELLTLGVLVEKIGRSSIHLRILGEIDGVTRLAARQVVAITQLDDLGATEIPPDLRDALMAYKERSRIG